MVKEESKAAASAANDSWATPVRFAALLASVLSAYFGPVIWGGRSFFYRDYGVLGYPVIALAREQFWRGEIPLWNPWSNCGSPFLAQWGTMALYPFSLIYLVLPLPWSLNLFCLLHLFWGGLGAYTLVRTWTRSPLAPAFAGLLFAINGVTLSCLIWPNYTVAIGWMPWVLHLGLAAGREGGAKTGLASLGAAMQLLAGAPELAALTWIMVLFLAFAGAETRHFRAFLRLGAIVLLAGGLIAAQFLPFWQLLVHSQRDAALTTDRWSFPIWGLGDFFAPIFHSFKTPEGIFFQKGQEFINSCYFGLVTLAFIGLIWRRPRHPLAMPMAALLGFLILMAMGDRTFLYPALRKLLPFVGLARFPVKFILPAMILVPALAAIGLDQFLDPTRSRLPARKRGLLISAAVVLGCLGLTLWRALQNPFPFDQPAATLENGIIRGVFLLAGVVAALVVCGCERPGARAVWSLVFAALLAVDLATHVPSQNPSLPNSVFNPGLWSGATGFPAPKWGEGRVWITPDAEDRLLRSAVKDLESDYLGKRIALWSNLNLIEGIPKVNGSSTLQIREAAQLQDLLYKPPRHAIPLLLDYLGAKFENDPVKVLEWRSRPSSLPLVAAGQKVVFTRDTLHAWIEGFDPRTVVWFPEALRPVIGEIAATEAKVKAILVAPEKIEIECDARQPCVVTIAQAAYPAWRARIDGRPARIWTANHAFQAVVVPGGRHTVVIAYEDEWFTRGVWIGGASLALSGALVWSPRRLKKDTLKPDSQGPRTPHPGAML